MREALVRILEDAREQQKQNREMKHQLEFDWSDKVQYYHTAHAQ